MKSLIFIWLRPIINDKLIFKPQFDDNLYINKETQAVIFNVQPVIK